ncbi:MAG TPA: glycosyltransferase family 4 protein [Allosphingosinicella sp.]|nr:glycosyltransferase family 4 protein [Allosphingosinicella sp.]
MLVVGARGIPDVEGGAEKNAEMLFPIIAASGFRVVVLGLHGIIRDGSFRGVELRSAPNRRILNTDKLFYYLYALSVARSLKPDIVHLQGLGASLFLWAYKLMGTRVVVRYGSVDYLGPKWGLIGRLGFLAAEYQTRFADAVIAVAPALARRLGARGVHETVHLIPNALDEPPPASEAWREAAGGDDAPFILMVGRVSAPKNIHRVIEGFRLFRERTGRDVRLLIAGGYQDEPYGREIYALRGEDVRLLGYCTRAQLEGLYRRCELFINSSVYEGSSNAVLEAISRDCPLILSGIPENRDFGLPDQVYFNPLDPAAIAESIAAALADPDRFRAPPSDFLRWSDVAAKTIAIYHSLLGTARG